MRLSVGIVSLHMDMVYERWLVKIPWERDKFYKICEDKFWEKFKASVMCRIQN